MAVARRNERVYNFVGREMLRGSMAALAHPIFTAAETLQLIRDILAQQLATSPGPRQVGSTYLSVCLSVGLSVCVPEHVGRDKTEQSGVVCNGLSRPGCRTSVSMHFSLPCLSAWCCHQSWTLLLMPHQLFHAVCRSCWRCLPSHLQSCRSLKLMWQLLAVRRSSGSSSGSCSCNQACTCLSIDVYHEKS